METKNDLPKRATVMLYIFMAIAFFGTMYGLHNDWTLYVIIMPWWAIVGVVLSLLLFKNCKKNTAYSGVLIVIIMSNFALLLVHRDTDFIVGRLVSSIAELMILMFAIQYPCD